jgi:hypothetical protein
MVKERYIPVKRDLRVGKVSKLLFVLGFLFLFIYLLLFFFYEFTLFSTNESVMLWIRSGYNDILLAASILLIAAAFFFCFLHRQFLKLADIADELQEICEQEETED